MCCSPCCGPVVCYKYEDCGPPQESRGGGPGAAEGGAETKQSKKNKQLRRIKSRELRASIMYYSCHCIKRNGLQHDCRRTGCNGEPACLMLPHPLCAPSQLARARGLADPAPFTEHLKGASGIGGGATGGEAIKVLSGKNIIICELMDINEGSMPPRPSSGADEGQWCWSGAVQGAVGGNYRPAELPVFMMKLCHAKLT